PSATSTKMPSSISVNVAGSRAAISLTLGTIAAVRRGGFVDRLVMMASFVGTSEPQFLVALLLLYLLAATLGWFPMSGYGSFS
ncbi:glutathione ABC transporter permease GsiC, partial [Rhizobium ruizarguesonis]